MTHVEQQKVLDEAAGKAAEILFEAAKQCKMDAIQWLIKNPENDDCYVMKFYSSQEEAVKFWVDKAGLQITNKQS